MVTTLTLTPQLDTATIRLVINGPPAEYPVAVINLSAGQIKAEAASAWSGFDIVTLYGDQVAFYTDAATSRITRQVTGLVVGARYRFTLRAARTPLGTVFGVTQNGSMPIPPGSGTWAHTYEWVANATTQTLFFDTYQNNHPYISGVQLTRIPSLDYDLAKFSLTRTDANGTRPVRLLDGQEIIDGTLVVEDAEAAMVGPVAYQLTSASGAVSQVVTTLDGAQGYRLAPAVFPQFAATLDLVTGYNGERPASTIVHDVIGRPDPVVRIGPFRTRRGTLTIWCDDYAGVSETVSVYARGEVVQLRQPDYPGLDMYHVTTRATEQPYDEEGRRWRVDVEYVEVGYPRGPLLGTAGWTWDDLVATFATWDDVLAYFATWNDVQIGPTT